jgi:hypothetical protein
MSPSEVGIEDCSKNPYEEIRRKKAKSFLTIILLAITAMIALVPVKKSVSSLFINHDKTCVLRSGLK